MKSREYLFARIRPRPSVPSSGCGTAFSTHRSKLGRTAGR